MPVSASSAGTTSRWLLYSVEGYAAYGKYKRLAYVSHLLLKFISILLTSISLGIRWWSVQYTPNIAQAEGGAFISIVCLSGQVACESKTVSQDSEPVLRTGQYAVIVCFLLAIITSWLLRFARRLGLYRMLAGQSERLLPDDPEAQLDGDGRKRLLIISFLAAVDLIQLLLILIGYSVFMGQIAAWYSQYVAGGPGAGTAYTSQLSYGTGVATGAAALALAAIVATISSAGVAMESKKQLGMWVPLPLITGMGVRPASLPRAVEQAFA